MKRELQKRQRQQPSMVKNNCLLSARFSGTVAHEEKNKKRKPQNFTAISISRKLLLMVMLKL
jgi:hypothetical protein